MGSEGKIIADLHAFKAFFRNEPTIPGFTKDWNQKYVTDFAAPVRFYLRGYEFTRQIDCFIDKILDRKKPCLCTFRDGYETDMVIERMNNNAIMMGK
jgi:hypothetical protein